MLYIVNYTLHGKVAVTSSTRARIVIEVQFTAKFCYRAVSRIMIRIAVLVHRVMYNMIRVMMILWFTTVEELEIGRH